MDEICSVKKRSRDLTVDCLKIAGKESVRDMIILTPADAVKKSAGTAVFQLSYRVNNEGYMASRDFENLTYFNDKVVSRQHAMALNPNESKIVTDDVTLDLKEGAILVRIDAFSKIAEDNETNNDVSSKILFRGFQGQGTQEPCLHIELLRIAGKPPAQGKIKLTKQQSIGEKKGRYAFPVEFVIRNFGVKAASGFDNGLAINGRGFYRQRNLTLAPGESKLLQENIYFPVCDGKLAIHADADGKYPKRSEYKQMIETQLYFQGFPKS